MRTMTVSLAVAISFAGAPSAGAVRKDELSAPFRLCVLDRSVILRQSRIALAMAAQFQQIRQQAQANFAQEQRLLDADTRALESLAASLPPAVLKSRRDMLAQRRAQLTKGGEQINRNLAQLDTELTNNIARISAPMMRAVEVEQKCSMSIARETILNLNDTSLDITAAVVDRMNAAPAPSFSQ